MPRPAPFALALSLLLLAACGAETPASSTSQAPLPPGPTAYAIAGRVHLEVPAPENADGLLNVHRLSDTLIAGSEPDGDAAFEALAALGVKTILSVDGKAPDREAAARRGLRVVHVPIQYAGITPDERLRIAKVFRELEGPFYVHCFHGKHRGPAAAALGRIVLDGATRERAVAEMRQIGGTSEKYGGLYETILRGPIPTAAETRAFAWDFPAAHTFKGFRQAMIGIARSWDRLEGASRRAYRPDPTHPDLDVGNEARMLVEHFRSTLSMDDVKERGEGFVASLAESRELAEGLRDVLGEAGLEGDPSRAAAARRAMAAVKDRCVTCHAAHRNKRPLPFD